MSALGPFGMNGNTNVLLDAMKSGPNPEVANMVSKRFVKFSEPAEGKKIENETLKTLTGGDAITARQCYSNETDHVQNHMTMVLEVRNQDQPNCSDVDRSESYSNVRFDNIR